MVEKLQWRLTGERGACYRLPVHLAKPHRDIDELDRLSQLTLESLKISDPIVRLELYANRFTPWVPINKALFDATNQGVLTATRCWSGCKPDWADTLSMVFRRKLIIARKMRGGGASPEKLDPLCAGRNRPLWLLPSPKPIHMRDGQLRVGHQHLLSVAPVSVYAAAGGTANRFVVTITRLQSAPSGHGYLEILTVDAGIYMVSFSFPPYLDLLTLNLQQALDHRDAQRRAFLDREGFAGAPPTSAAGCFVSSILSDNSRKYQLAINGCSPTRNIWSPGCRLGRT